jgi:hypothetical protein
MICHQSYLASPLYNVLLNRVRCPSDFQTVYYLVYQVGGTRPDGAVWLGAYLASLGRTGYLASRGRRALIETRSVSVGQDRRG